jgi:hypothetical protein
MGIYVDDDLKYVVEANSFNTKLSLNPGSHKTVVQQWDHCGGSSFTAVPLTVTTATGVFVTSPANNSTVESPVRFTATASTSTCPKGVATIGIYTAPSPDKKVYVTQGDSLNTTVSLSPGTYNTVVQQWTTAEARPFSFHHQVSGDVNNLRDQRALQGLARLGRTGAQVYIQQLPAGSHLFHDANGRRDYVQSSAAPSLIPMCCGATVGPASVLDLPTTIRPGPEPEELHLRRVFLFQHYWRRSGP